MGNKLNKDNKTKVKNMKKEVKFIDVVIIGIFAFLFLFVCTILIIVYIKTFEPSTLIVSVFGFCGLECGLLSSMTKRKMSIQKELDKIMSSVEEKVAEVKTEAASSRADINIDDVDDLNSTSPIEHIPMDNIDEKSIKQKLADTVTFVTPLFFDK